MVNNCSNCTYHSKALMVCFCEANEGMRVFSPDKQTCHYFTAKITCPKCGSEEIYIKSGVTTDLFTCKDCNYEWR